MTITLPKFLLDESEWIGQRTPAFDPAVLRAEIATATACYGGKPRAWILDAEVWTNQANTILSAPWTEALNTISSASPGVGRLVYDFGCMNGSSDVPTWQAAFRSVPISLLDGFALNVYQPASPADAEAKWTQRAAEVAFLKSIRGSTSRKILAIHTTRTFTINPDGTHAPGSLRTLTTAEIAEVCRRAKLAGFEGNLCWLRDTYYREFSLWGAEHGWSTNPAEAIEQQAYATRFQEQGSHPDAEIPVGVHVPAWIDINNARTRSAIRKYG